MENINKITYLPQKVKSSSLAPPAAHLSQRRLLVSQPHDEDAVGLADAALCPGRHGAVRLVEDDPVDVLLLGQPAGQTVLMDAFQE